MVHKPLGIFEPWEVDGLPHRMRSLLRIDFDGGPEKPVAFFTTARLVQCRVDPSEQKPSWHVFGDAYISWVGAAPPMLITLVLDAGLIKSVSKTDRSGIGTWEYSFDCVVCIGPKVSDKQIVKVLRSYIDDLSEPDADGPTTARWANATTVGIVKLDGASNPIIGSGVLVSDDGMVATNRHVVEDIVRDLSPEEYQTKLGVLVWKSSIGKTYGFVLNARRVWVINSIARRDGTLRPEDTSDLAFIDLAIAGSPHAKLLEAPSSLVPGQPIFSCGYPRGDEYLLDENGLRQRMPFVHAGIISAQRQDDNGTLEQLACDLPVLPGSSGSPVFLRDRAELIGLVSHSLLYRADVEHAKKETEKDVPRAWTNIFGPSSLILPISTIKKSLEMLKASRAGNKPVETWSAVMERMQTSRNAKTPW